MYQNNWRAYERKVWAFERAGAPLLELLRTLVRIAAVLDPDGTLPTLVLDGVEPGPWSVKPRQVPEWRRQLVSRLEAPETPEGTAREMSEEQLTALFPVDLFPD